MSDRSINLIGRSFGRLTAVARAGRTARGHALWRCKCLCGNTTTVRSDSLRKTTRSCGCLQRQVARDHLRRVRIPFGRTIHGQSKKVGLYTTWLAMKQRCFNPASTSYRWYGARGVTVCERWRRDFSAFAADVGQKPSPSHSIDRIDVDGDYEPGNVRWATPKEQRRNQRAKKFDV